MIMNDANVSLTVSDYERRLITTLRDLPESPLRDRVHRLLDELVTFIRFPRCQWMQGDGVPCGSIDRDCEHCVHLLEMLDHLSESISTK